MNIFFVFVLPVLAAALAGMAVWLWCRGRSRQQLALAAAQAESELALCQERLQACQRQLEEQEEGHRRLLEETATLRAEHLRLRGVVAELETRLEEARKGHQEKQELLLAARQELADAFKALSSDIFQQNSRSFLDLAKATLGRFQESAKSELEQRRQSIDQMVRPLAESLLKVDQQLRQVEKDRVEAYSSLTEQVRSLATTQVKLQGETANLVRALRSPVVRGRWGEIQLRRVVEMAGMVEYCDFVEQETVEGDNGRLRPDMVIKLPNQKNIVVDSKAALSAYLEALEAENESERLAKLKDHARQVRTHLSQLASKNYWGQFKPTPEFVVLFLPGENFFSAALEQDPELIEFGVSQRVILATPTTLIALLRAVSYGWRQERIAEHAQKIGELGRQLYERLATMAGYFQDMRKGLGRAVTAYNRSVASMESRVLVAARRFKELDPDLKKEIPDLEILESVPRTLEAEPESKG